MSQVTNLPVSQIIPGNNHRKVFDQIKLHELAASIAANGLAQPITVRPIATDMFGQTTYQIVAGERRFRAVSQILNYSTVPALIRDLSDRQARDIMLVENTGRVDLNPIEESDAYWDHTEQFRCTPEEIAQIAGKSAGHIRKRLSLRRLADDIRHLVAHNQLPVGHAEAMTDLDFNRQHIALRIYNQSQNGLGLSAFRAIISQLLEEQSQDSLFDLETFWSQQVQKLDNLPRRGKRAVTGAPTRSDVPQLHVKNGDNIGSLIDRYIAQLLTAGFSDEAAAIGNFYNTIVRHNFISVPPTPQLLQ